MSEFGIPEDIDEEIYDEVYEHADILAIQEEYRQKRLIESLIGPVLSTLFHLGLIIALAFLITDKYKTEASEIEVTMQEVEEVTIEEPPPVEEPEPEEVEPEDTSDPVLTTVALENVETSDAALEDVSDEEPSTEDDSTIEAVSDIVVSPSAFASPNVFGGRSAAGRASAVSKFGGSRTGQQSLLKALYWLKTVQRPDGSWADTVGYRPAMTGLALLTFLAYGETQASKEFGTTVRKAMEWLATSKLETGASHGYPHAIKTYAIAEAYAMTGISILEDAMNTNVRVLIKGMLANGSYDYNYKHTERQDLSFAGWNYQALKAAYGAGCEEPGLMDSIEKAVQWLKQTGASNDMGNGFPYVLKGKTPQSAGKESMRAVGVLCLQLYGEGKTPEIKDEIKKIATVDIQTLSWSTPKLYSWYYATQAMFQHGGKDWKAWNKKFQKELNDNQHPEGYWEDPKTAKLTGLDNKVYGTTLCALMLTVYYRYLPSSKGALGGKTAKKEKAPVMEEEGLDLID